VDWTVGIISGRRFDGTALPQTQLAATARFVEKDALI
jgi:hypothetical protein